MQFTTTSTYYCTSIFTWAFKQQFKLTLESKQFANTAKYNKGCHLKLAALKLIKSLTLSYKYLRHLKVSDGCIIGHFLV